MYKTIEKIPDIASYKVYDENIFLRVDNKKYNLQLFKLDFEYNIKWVSEEEVVLGFYYTSGKLIYTSKKNMTTVCRDDNNKLLYTVNEILYDIYPNSKSIFGLKYIGQSEEYDRIIFNLSSGKLEKVLSEQYASLRLIIYKEYIIRYDKSKGQLFLHSNHFTPLWQADLSELGAYEDWQGKHQGEIANVYVVEDKVLVNAGPFIFCYALETGKLLWQLKSAEGKFYSMAIDHGVAYLTYWRHYAEIDINKGVFIIEKEIIDFEYGHKKIFFQAKGTPVYYKGLIWVTLYTGGVPFIAALLPEKGEIIWVQHIASPHSINEPKFHNNKMYLLDTGGTLHIFEEEPPNT